MSDDYDPRYADDNDEPFYIEGYHNFPREIARLAKKMFRARDDVAAVEGANSPLAKEIDASLSDQGYAQWKELESRVDDWYKKPR